jgi:predicted TIM-barrel fold metal-dependent hydrolase
VSTSDPVIDCERHVLVESLSDLAEYLDRSWRQRMLSGEFALPPAGPHPGVQIESKRTATEAPDQVAAQLDRCAERALLIPSQGLVSSGWLNHTMAAVFSAALNDYMLERWSRADPRFRIAVSVASHDGELAAREIRRAGAHPAVAAVATSVVAVNMGQRHYHPIYEAACELDLPVIVHPGGFEGSVVGPAVLGGIGPRTPEETFSLMPQIAMANVASLVYDGVFARFPRLRIVFAGFGFAWAVPLLWRTDAEWRGLRVEVPWLTSPPSEVVADHVRFVIDGAAELSAGAWHLAEMLPEGTLLYGSDAPFTSGAPAEILDGAPEALRSRIAADNACETFSRLGVTAAVA